MRNKQRWLWHCGQASVLPHDFEIVLWSFLNRSIRSELVGPVDLPVWESISEFLPSCSDRPSIDWMCQTREATTVNPTSIFIRDMQTCVSVDRSWLVLVIVVDVSWGPLSSITILLDGNCWNKHITYIKMDFLSGYSARTSAIDKSPVMNRNTKGISFTTTHLRRRGIDQFWRHLWRHWKHVREFWPVQCVECLRNRIDRDETCESVHWTLDHLASYE